MQSNVAQFNAFSELASDAGLICFDGKVPHFVNFKIDTQYDCVRYAIMQSSQWSQSNMKT